MQTECGRDKPTDMGWPCIVYECRPCFRCGGKMWLNQAMIGKLKLELCASCTAKALEADPDFHTTNERSTSDDHHN